MPLDVSALLACSDSAAPASKGWPPAFLATGAVWLAMLAAMLVFRRLRKEQYIVAYGLITVLALCFVPAVNAAREAAHQNSCACNLAQIGLALQTYADIYKSFPPAYVTDSKGNRIHSWRVLILPFMEQKPLYDVYDFNEPWNGPHNRLLARYMPPLYRCPSDDLDLDGETSYSAIDGPGTVWSGSRGSTFADMKDGTSNTIAVAEAAGSGIHWMEPRDVPFSALAQGLMGPKKPGLASRHDGQCEIVFCDGHISHLNSNLPVAALQALTTRAGGEPITFDY